MSFEKPNVFSQETGPKPIGELVGGEKVFDRFNSHRHGNEGVLEKALSRIDANGRDFIVEEVVFDENVGTCDCVSTSEGDEIIHATRVGRRGPTRFVKNKNVIDSNVYTVILKKVSDDTYTLITSFVGPKAEKEPWDRTIVSEEEKNASKQFWSNHALVWGSQPIIEGTEIEGEYQE